MTFTSNTGRPHSSYPQGFLGKFHITSKDPIWTNGLIPPCVRCLWVLVSTRWHETTHLLSTVSKELLHSHIYTGNTAGQLDETNSAKKALGMNAGTILQQLRHNFDTCGFFLLWRRNRQNVIVITLSPSKQTGNIKSSNNSLTGSVGRVHTFFIFSIKSKKGDTSHHHHEFCECSPSSLHLSTHGPLLE